MTSSPHLILASASPRRAELLRQAGISFDVMPADVDERVREGELPEQYVRRVAEDKAWAIAGAAPDTRIVAADTIVVVDGRILGKPRDEVEAKGMLAALSGRMHEVLTAVTLVSPDGSADPPHDTRLERTVVAFAPLSAVEIDWYVASGEPMDKAGAYAIQGLASRFVTRIDGSYSNVVGLPVALVYQMLNHAP